MRISRTLAALGAFFVLAVAVAGCGSAIPGDSVASVAGNPITTQAFDHWMYIAAKGNASQSPGAPVIVPNDPPGFGGCIKQVRAQIPSLAKTPDKQIKSDCAQLFQSLSGQVMDFLIKSYWYQAEAYRLHIHLTDAQVQAALEKDKKQQFPTSASFQSFLASTGQTLQDIEYRVRVNELFKRLLERNAKKVTPAAIQAYFKSHASNFGSPESRDIRIVRTNSQAQAQAALTALRSGQGWTAVAKRYSVDTATKNSGGLLQGITYGEEENALNKVAFSAPVNKLEGPVHGTFGWYVVEVTKITKATTFSLGKATPMIRQLLTQQYQSQAQTAVDAKVKKLFGGKTLCRSTYEMADCSGYKAPKTTTTAPVAPAPTTTPSGSGTVTLKQQTSPGSSTTKKK